MMNRWSPQRSLQTAAKTRVRGVSTLERAHASLADRSSGLFVVEEWFDPLLLLAIGSGAQPTTVCCCIFW